MFIAIEDEAGVANLVVWPSLFERQRRVVLSAGMMAVRGKIQWEGAVVHLVAHHLTDLSDNLASVGERDGGFPLPHGRGDQVRDGRGFWPDQRDRPPRAHRTRDIPDLHIDSIKVKTRDFRLSTLCAERGAQTRSPVIPFVPKVSDPRGPEMLRSKLLSSGEESDRMKKASTRGRRVILSIDVGGSHVK